MRLDQRLKATRQELSWRQIRDAIEKGQVTVDGRVRKDPGLDVISGAAIELNLNRPAQRRIRAPFELLHEDEQILVLNKPAGLLSIPSTPDAGSSEDTVLRRVREYMEFKRGHRTYVGMLHRLDRDTSGALAVALSKDAHAAGRELFKEHRFDRQYLAIVHGIPDPPSGTVSARISSTYEGGRRKLVDRRAPGLDATTDYRVRDRLQDAALVELTLHTGRQHQIRLHLEKLGHPLVGERVYTAASAFAEAPADRSKSQAMKASARPREGQSRPMLHAWRLAFPHPVTGTRISVEAPMPQDFVRTLRRFMIRP
jgi:23S rRNA pseudouridine1911/1915/1917 synthase